MRALALVIGAGLVAASAVAANAQSASYTQNNYLNLAEIDQAAMINALRLNQGGVKNFARVRQAGYSNQVAVKQNGRANGVGLLQYGDVNAAEFHQGESTGYTLAPAGGRISRSVVQDSGVTTYVTTYTNGPVSILQASIAPQVYGRLGRR
jgi:hypothetical protein